MLTELGSEIEFRYMDSYVGKPLFMFPKFQRYSCRVDSPWPFLQNRIPSAKRPEIKSLLEELGVPEDDFFGKLLALGATTISNPIEILEVVDD